MVDKVTTHPKSKRGIDGFMPNKGDNEYKDLYSANEDLLQSYRQIFISAVSFLLAVGVYAAEKENHPVFLAIVILNLTIIIWGWVPIVKSRAKIVDFYKFEIYSELDEFGKQKYCQTDYVNRQHVREEANLSAINRNLDNKSAKWGPWRLTRIKIDVILPIMFIIVWCLLFFYYEHEFHSAVSQIIEALVAVSVAFQVLREYF